MERALTVDSHQHFWRFNSVRDAWITEAMGTLRRDYLPEHLAPELSANGIDLSMAVQADQSEAETHFLLDLAERNPFVAGVVGWIDLRAVDLAKRLQHYAQFPKLRGFRHVAQSEPDDFLRHPGIHGGVARLGDFGFTYDILIYARQLPAALTLVEACPGQPFVIDHLAKPEVTVHEIDRWERGVRALAAHPNVMCKLSGLITEADWRNWTSVEFQPYLDIVWEAFGPQRLMYGSDWPVCLLAGSYSKVKGLIADFIAPRSAAERDAVFGGNAARFYGLKEHGLTASR